MNIRLQYGLPFVSVSLIYFGRQAILENTLLDTGSIGTVFSIDKIFEIGIKPEPDDPVREIRGVGGTEFVFIKQVDKLSLGNYQIKNFEIEVGAMDYGVEIDGIIGLDFLLQVKAKIDLERLVVY